MKTKWNLLLLPILFLAFACNLTVDANLKEEPIVADASNAQNSLDYIGSYKGVLPCADCEGVETTLTILADNQYELSSKYLGKGDGQPYVSKGAYAWRPDGNTIELQGNTDGAFLYFVSENRVWQLDMEGNKIEGSLAEKYVLAKVTE